MNYEFTKSEKKIVRQVIETALQRDFEASIMEVDSIIQRWKSKKLDNRKAYQEIYRHDLRIDHELVRQILALPRESLLSDLTKVIYDSMARFIWFKNETEWNESTHNFVLHAIFLLSELKAEERLWVLLDILRQDENYLDYWFNDFLTEGMWESIYNLGFYKLDELSAFIKEPGRYCYCRTEIAVALSQIALHHPERRNEVVACFRDILNFFIEHKEDDRIIDMFVLDIIVIHRRTRK